MISKVTGWVSTHRRRAFLVLGILAVTVPLGSYEGWRLSVESQIRNEVESRSLGDVCMWFVSSGVVDTFDDRYGFLEGGEVHRTDLGDWSRVVNAALEVRSRLLQSGKQPCVLDFGLTRTLFILLTNRTEGLHFNPFFVDVYLVYARYAPL